MMIPTSHFGPIEVEPSEILRFPNGLIGFASEREFVLIRHGESRAIAWLQSLTTPYLALPVVSAHMLASRYPDVPIGPVAEAAGMGSDPDELAVLVVLSAPSGRPATVNLMAPIIVNATTRLGGQVLLEGSQFTTRELFVVPPVSEEVSSSSRAETPVARSAQP